MIVRFVSGIDFGSDYCTRPSFLQIKFSIQSYIKCGQLLTQIRYNQKIFQHVLYMCIQNYKEI